MEGVLGIGGEKLMTQDLTGRYKTPNMLGRAGNNQELNGQSPTLHLHLQFCDFMQAHELGFNSTEEGGEILDSVMVVIYDLEVRLEMRSNLRKSAVFLVSLCR